MEKEITEKKVFRVRQEVKDFACACRLARYVLIAAGCTFMIAAFVLAIAYGEPYSAEETKEFWGIALQLSLFLDGVILILMTFADMIICGVVWLMKHRIHFNKVITVEKRNVKII